MRRPLFLVFVVLAALEILTLGVLLVNLATVHQPMVARAIGPIHGAVYLVVVLIGLFTPGLRWGTRLLSLIPVLGGIFAAVGARRAKGTTNV